MAYDFYVRSKQDLIDAVEEYGIVPYFATSIPGFSLEEHCSPSVLFSDFEDDTWAWKGPVIRATGCAYGKFFEKKSTYVSREVFLDLANYRRDGYDFDARYDDGLAKFQDKQLYDLIDAHAPVLSKELRVTGGYAYSGRWQKTEGKKGSATLSIPSTSTATAAAGVLPSTARRRSSWEARSRMRSIGAAQRNPTTACWIAWPRSSPARRKNS